MSKVAEIEFASLDELITNTELAFQTHSSEVNFRGRAGIVPGLAIG